MSLTGQVAIVTGGAQGIGRAIVERLAAEGVAGVVIADVQGAEAAAQEIARRHGDVVLAWPTDVSSPAQVETVAQATLERWGRINILVNNAGICPVVAWDDTTPEDWNRILAINLTGMYLCPRAVVPSMRAQRYGRIVYISSEAAFSGSLVAHVAYGASKAGVLALMRSVAKGFAQDGIQANAIAPGPVDTPLAHNLGGDFWAAAEGRTLLKRHASAREIADVAFFLVSDQSTYVTGQVVRVNAGADLT
jgi:3-oxoacyl-[acyl-carrier protein] reductase